MKRAEALALFGLEGAPTEDQVHEAFKAVARTAHPDLGGTEAAMRAALEARALLMVPTAQEPSVAARRGKCGVCRGTGKVAVTKGFGSVTMRCVLCGGGKG